MLVKLDGTHSKKDTEDQQDSLNKTAAFIVESLEKSSSCLSKFVERDRRIMKAIAKQQFVNGIGECATQFAISRDYHLKAHTDTDYYYTMLTVCAGEGVDNKHPIYYFTFPTYSVMVPVSSGETIIFQPHVMHSCSNPITPNAFVISVYVLAKTILRGTT